MFTVPPSVAKLGMRAGKWFTKNGPALMTIGGGFMAVAGGVMACQATLHADEVLEEHRRKMDIIQAAKDLSDQKIENDEVETAAEVYTEKAMKHDKFVVYTETAFEFVKLYIPAVTVGLGGIGLMQGAFALTEKRRAAAVSALSAMSEAYNSLLVRAEDANVPVLPEEKRPVEMKTAKGKPKKVEQVVLNPDDISDPYFFIFDSSNVNWANGNGFLLNERFLTATIDALNYKLSAGSVDEIWVNDVLKAWDMEPTSLGHFHGWNGRCGDLIAYELIPYRIIREDDNMPDEPPLLLPTDMDTLRDMELSDIQDGYCIGIRLLSSSEGNGGLIPPRMIYHEVYGE